MTYTYLGQADYAPVLPGTVPCQSCGAHVPGDCEECGLVCCWVCDKWVSRTEMPRTNPRTANPECAACTAEYR